MRFPTCSKKCDTRAPALLYLLDHVAKSRIVLLALSYRGIAHMKLICVVGFLFVFAGLSLAIRFRTTRILSGSVRAPVITWFATALDYHIRSASMMGHTSTRPIRCDTATAQTCSRFGSIARAVCSHSQPISQMRSFGPDAVRHLPTISLEGPPQPVRIDNKTALINNRS